METPFVPFPKIARLSREIVITEKIDGTNAQVFIGEQGEFLVGSRNRWITPTDDNYGFARWAHENKDELLTLGPGAHFGEWFGSKIQRGYDLKEKRFALFTVGRWSDTRPQCCEVVPTLYRGPFSETAIEDAILSLRTHGSAAVPGFMRPEGIIIFHSAAGFCFKKTLEKDQEPKSFTAEGGKAGA